MQTPPLAFAVLYVSDYAVAAPYYTDTVGLMPIMELDAPDARQFAPGSSGAQFSIVQATADTPAPGTVELHFSGHDLPQLRAAYIARGATAGEITRDDFSAFFTLPVPDGAPLTVDQPYGGAVPQPDTGAAPILTFAMLHATDFDAASRYYTDTLGFAPVPGQGGPGFRMFAPAEGGIPFAIGQTTPDTAAAGTVELYFSTDDLEAARGAMQARGAQVSEIIAKPFGTLFTVPALDGEPLYIMRPPQ